MRSRMLKIFWDSDVWLGVVVGPVNASNITPIQWVVQWQMFQFFLVVVAVE